MRAKKQHANEPMTTRAIDTQHAVFGLGATGLACARFLVARGIGCTIIDTRDNPPELEALERSMPGIPVLAGTSMPAHSGRCEHLLLSPGVSRAHPFVVDALRHGVEVIGDIELFARYAEAPVLAVTGSNGKSTVVTLVTEILRGAGLDVLSGGNLGTPALDLLDQAKPDCYVLELSSFQLESTESLSPRVACILNVSPDHMDRYPDFASYVAAKQRIYMHAEHCVLNADDEVLRGLKPKCGTQYVSIFEDTSLPFRVERDNDVMWLVANGQRFIKTDELALQGEHNYMNALAAIAITDVMGVTREVQARVLGVFAGLPHRSQVVLRHAHVDWIDDSKGTNVAATCAAIRTVFAARGGVLIAGGQGKGADFTILAETVREHVHSVVLIGEDAKTIAAVLGRDVGVHFALDMQAAVSAAAGLARSGEAVLLSPACASFDMFENFEARGRAFADAVTAERDR